MKIIKKGNNPDLATFQASCRKCGTVIEFERQEAKFIPDQRDGDYLSIICPLCGQDISVALRR